MIIAVILCVLYECQAALSQEIEDWRDDYLEWCKVPHGDSDQADLFCVRSMWNYLPLNVEVLAFEPAALVYRELAPRHYVEEFLKDATKKRKEEGYQDVSHDGSIVTKYHSETRIERRKSEGAEKIVFHNRGGQKPPRFDFIDNEDDERTQNHGNRFASLMLMMKKPEEEGRKFCIYPV
ncbi:hypothetical protein OESDEN_10723 [Oesophagostomum dentatum]|uniref:Uncharacterized protein n=1 Tax=Oesophagostomum dentatum TaxID=61180 RepID=A0A0B1T211_OESDE|nr:hypothetical protein OESDEN_10723 [Oesophagostomum dentatum]